MDICMYIVVVSLDEVCVATELPAMFVVYSKYVVFKGANGWVYTACRTAQN